MASYPTISIQQEGMLTPISEGMHIEDVKTVNGEWIVTGTSGVVLIVCGIGPDDEEGAAASLQPRAQRCATS